MLCMCCRFIFFNIVIVVDVFYVMCGLVLKFLLFYVGIKWFLIKMIIFLDNVIYKFFNVNVYDKLCYIGYLVLCYCFLRFLFI